jgi:hypothetical protein
VPITLWWGWDGALFLTALALLLLAAALARGTNETGDARWPLLGATVNVVVAAIGVFVFTGRPGWPAWYTLLWIPGALLVIRPAATWVTLAAIALSAGAGAALMTWGNALSARTVVALADVANLGTVPDPLGEPALTELAASIAAASTPPDAADLYRAWRRSGLRREGYPVRLMVWDDSSLDADVALDVSVPDSTLQELVRTAPPGQSIARVAAGPGVLQILNHRLDSSRVLSLAIGPRTQLIPPAVLGRLLETGAERSPLYRLTVTPMWPRRRKRARPLAARGWAIGRRGGFCFRPVRRGRVIPLGRPARFWCGAGCCCWPIWRSPSRSGAWCSGCSTAAWW